MVDPAVVAAVLPPALGAGLVLARGERARRSALAPLVAALTLGLTLVCAWLRRGALPVFHARGTVLFLDGLGALFAALASLLALGVLLAAPRSTLSHRAQATTLAVLAATLGVYTAMSPWVLAACWSLGLFAEALLLRVEGPRRTARLHALFALGSVAPLVLGLALLPRVSPEGGFACLAIALLLRKAVFPFHPWLPATVERAPLPMLPLAFGTHLGAFLVLRVLVPASQQVAARDLRALVDLALFSAAYASVAALAQRDLRRGLGYVIASQLAMVPAGIAMMDAPSALGSTLQMLSISLSATGLVLLTGALEARIGRVDLRRVGGLGARFPRAATLFLVLALGAGGLPPSLHFVAEDLLLRALMNRHPFVATVFLAVTLLNGITLLRSYFRAFYGPLRGDPGGPIPDLGARELAPLGALATLVFALGVAPQPLLDHVGREIAAILGTAALR